MGDNDDKDDKHADELARLPSLLKEWSGVVATFGGAVAAVLAVLLPGQTPAAVQVIGYAIAAALVIVGTLIFVRVRRRRRSRQLSLLPFEVMNGAHAERRICLADGEWFPSFVAVRVEFFIRQRDRNRFIFPLDDGRLGALIGEATNRGRIAFVGVHSLWRFRALSGW